MTLAIYDDGCRGESGHCRVLRVKMVSFSVRKLMKTNRPRDCKENKDTQQGMGIGNLGESHLEGVERLLRLGIPCGLQGL